MGRVSARAASAPRAAGGGARAALLVRLALALLLGVGAPPALVLLGAARQPEIAVRTVPHFAHTGRILAAQPPGQLFLCRDAGLERIELRPVSMGPLPTTPLELVLREGGPTGAVLRRASFQPGVDQAVDGRIRFAFEPLEESAGRVLHFELRPGQGAQELALGVWVRTCGQRGSSAPWGPAHLTENRYEIPFQSPYPDLSGAVVGCSTLDPEQSLRVSVLDEQGETLRAASVHGLRLREGHACLRFEPPLADSYGRVLRLVIECDPGVVLRGRRRTPSYATLHGTQESLAEPAGPALLGLTRGGVLVPGEALVFRAFTRAEPLSTLLARGSHTVWLAWGAWLALVLVALSLPLRAPPR